MLVSAGMTVKHCQPKLLNSLSTLISGNNMRCLSNVEIFLIFIALITLKNKQVTEKKVTTFCK